jgi:hypothetical protein
VTSRLQLANGQGRRDRHGQMHVVVRAADFMHEGAGSVDNSFFQTTVGDRFDRWRQQWRTGFRVPDDVQIDFAIIVS